MTLDYACMKQVTEDIRKNGKVPVFLEMSRISKYSKLCLLADIVVCTRIWVNNSETFYL